MGGDGVLRLRQGGGEGWCSETKTGWWRGGGRDGVPRLRRGGMVGGGDGVLRLRQGGGGGRHGVPSLTLCFFEVVPLRWTDRVVYWHENARLFDRNYLPVCSSPRLCVPTHALHCARVCRGDLAALCMHVAGVCELPWPTLRSPVCLVSDAAQCAVSPVCWAGYNSQFHLTTIYKYIQRFRLFCSDVGYIGCRVYCRP